MYYYTIIRDCEYKIECDRCHRSLSVAVSFVRDGKLIRVGRECAKHYGIVWTPKVGPMSADADTFRLAVDIFRERRRIKFGWPGGWAKCQNVRDALGTVAWKRAAIEAMK